MTASRVLRTVVISLMALALAFQVVRSAGVTHFVDGQPEIAGKIWPDHPRVILSEAMADIGVSAARGQVAKAATLAAVRDAARHAPLAVEPYLIEGAAALSAGKPARAERLFVEAKRRDPRSAAAHFFLAQQYLSTGRAPAGLAEAALLVRLVGGSSSLVPGIAQFAGAPGSAPLLRQLFAADPVLQGEVLAYLARDARNADLVVALAGASLGRAGAAADAPLWQSTLLAALVEKGEFLRARNLWLKIAGLRSAPLGLFNPQFAKLNAPAPFNWTLSSGDFGVAEPVAPGGLQIIYYGRADASLASQLLVLPPGSYELRMSVVRQADTQEPSGLSWSLSCRPGDSEILKLPMSGAGASKRISGAFTVPANCPAQLLKLSGAAREFTASEQAVITDLELVRGKR